MAGIQFADKFREAKGSIRATGSTGSTTSSSSATGVTVNGTSSGVVNGTAESPQGTPNAAHKTASVRSNSSASSGEVSTMAGHNRPFLIYASSLCSSKSKCKAAVMKIIFYFHGNNLILTKVFALSLILKVRGFGTQKWPIPLCAILGCASLKLDCWMSQTPWCYIAILSQCACKCRSSNIGYYKV